MQLFIISRMSADILFLLYKIANGCPVYSAIECRQQKKTGAAAVRPPSSGLYYF
jgi:hypothetical protein